MENKKHSDKTINYINNYNREHYRKYILIVRKDDDEMIDFLESIKETQSINSYIMSLLKKEMKKKPEKTQEKRRTNLCDE